MHSTNPATGELEASFPALSAQGLDERLGAAIGAFRDWRERDVRDRCEILRRAAALLDEEPGVHATLMTREMGKPIRAARDEVAKCALGLRYYADNAPAHLADAHIAGDGLVAYEPLGAVLAVMPWNFPYWQVIRFAAPTLAVGNVALLKHASNVPRCALEIERLFARAGAPRGVFQTLLVEATSVSAIIGDDRVAAVTLTGSEAAGRAVGAAAGAHLKKSVLELGGSDPFVVLPSADVARAATTAAAARTVNSGQSCIAAKRFIVTRDVAGEFTRRFTDAMRALRVGDPMREDVDVGPLATARIRDELVSQVERTVAAGATVRTGGRAMDGPGFFYEPTVLTDVPFHSPAAVEETFGPVGAVLVADSSDHALELANASRFGLGASVWTTDEAEAEHFTRALEAGTVFVNGMVASDPRFPFGGIKRSGYGRELGAEGLREFANVKTIRRPRSPDSSRSESE